MAIKPTESDQVETIDYNGKKIHLASLSQGHEYNVEGLFDYWRHAANREQALQFAQEDADTEGKAHEWRT